MTALIFGASAGLGRALARELAARRHNLYLLARDDRDLAAEAAHIRNVYNVSVNWTAIDASNPDTMSKLACLTNSLSFVRHLFYPIGMESDQDDALLPPNDIHALLNANLGSIVCSISLFLPQLLAAHSGNIVGIGSVAAIRGRGRNVTYAAAKRGLESYFESLRHQIATSGVKTQFYRLGYVDTQMSYGRSLLFPKLSPDEVAKVIADNLGKDVPRATVPAFWVPISYLLKALPWPLYRRFKF